MEHLRFPTCEMKQRRGIDVDLSAPVSKTFKQEKNGYVESHNRHTPTWSASYS
jgi:hypothetical protein